MRHAIAIQIRNGNKKINNYYMNFDTFYEDIRKYLTTEEQLDNYYTITNLR